jgi:hypothetical protein
MTAKKIKGLAVTRVTMHATRLGGHEIYETIER